MQGFYASTFLGSAAKEHSSQSRGRNSSRSSTAKDLRSCTKKPPPADRKAISQDRQARDCHRARWRQVQSCAQDRRARQKRKGGARATAGAKKASAGKRAAGAGKSSTGRKSTRAQKTVTRKSSGANRRVEKRENAGDRAGNLWLGRNGL
jgi:hypothetical protein